MPGGPMRSGLVRLLALSVFILSVTSGAAFAQRLPHPAHLMAATAAPGPCPYDPIDIDKYGRKDFKNPPEEHAKDGHLRTTLAVRYTDPAAVTIAGCHVTLRSYNGAIVG